MSDYKVVIKRIDPKRHYGFRYKVAVYELGEEARVDLDWTCTHWGARYAARKIIKKHELPEAEERVVEEYML